MRRVLIVSLVSFGLLVAGLILRDGRIVALALPCILYLAAGLAGSSAPAALLASRAVSTERAGPDTLVTFHVAIANSGPSLEEVLFEDDVPPGLTVCDGSPSHVLHLPSGSTATWSYTVRGERGSYTLSPIRATVRDAFGLTERGHTLPAGGHLIILPPVLRLRHVALRPRRTRVYSGSIPSRGGGPGAEFLGVREYQAGDPPRWINWRATARHPATLYANEFEQERVTDVGLVVDGRQRANMGAEGRSIFEYSVLAAAALADAFLAQGNRVSLLVYGKYPHWTLPGYGKLQRERILRALAQAAPGTSQVFDDLDHIPTQLFPAQSQVVLISPLVPDDAPVLLRLRARGYQVLIISPDPIAFELSALRDAPQIALAARFVRLERNVMLQRLGRAGVQVINWDVTIPFEQIVHTRLARPLAWLRTLEGPA